jgi:hypothetical protein
MNNNDKLKAYIRTFTNDNLAVVGTNRTEVNSAGRTRLEEITKALGGDPQQITGSAVANAVNTNPAPTGNSLNDAFQQIQDALNSQGSATIDEDQIMDIVKDAFKTDVQPTIDDLSDKVDALAPLAGTLQDIADAMKTTAGNRLPLATSVASGKNPLLEVIAPYYIAGDANPTKVCISAPPSYGKSYSIALLGQSYDTFITHGCSDDMDEWSDLLGECKPKAEGGFIITDGKLAQAMRSASEGKNTLFFMDEVFRLSPKVMEKMLDFLAPQADANGVKKYKLTTKQNANGVLEVLEADMDKLHIVCATNLCEVVPPEAFRSRFLFKHVRFDVAMIKHIAESVADKYSITDADDLGTAFATAMAKSREMHASGQLLSPLDVRHLEAGCIHANDATAEGVAKWVADEALDSLLMWNSDNGDIIEDSVNGVKEIQSILAGV